MIRLKVRHYPGRMNKTEARYAQVLSLEAAAGGIVWWGFEALTFKLAHDTRYTPDFILVRQDGTLHAHEVKGFWRDDAKAKIKVAANLFPWICFEAVTLGKGAQWQHECFEPAEMPRVK